MTTYRIETQMMNGTWKPCANVQTWNGTQWVSPAYSTEQEAREAAEAAFPDRYPEGAHNATFRIVIVA